MIRPSPHFLYNQIRSVFSDGPFRRFCFFPCGSRLTVHRNLPFLTACQTARIRDALKLIIIIGLHFVPPMSFCRPLIRESSSSTSSSPRPLPRYPGKTPAHGRLTEPFRGTPLAHALILPSRPHPDGWSARLKAERWSLGSSVYTTAPSPARRRLRLSPGSRYALWSDRILQAPHAPHTGKMPELLPDLLNAGALVLPLDLLLKVADHEVLALLRHRRQARNQT